MNGNTAAENARKALDEIARMEIAPKKPKPPDIQHLCDSCLQTWGTCRCRQIVSAMLTALIVVQIAVGVLATLFMLGWIQ